MITDEVIGLLNMKPEDVINTPASVTLLRCIRILYLHGGQPRTCSTSQFEYLYQLQINGIELAKHYDMVTKKTHTASKQGLTFRHTFGHILWDNLTDEECIINLTSGAFTEDDFIVLPEGYGKKKTNKVDEPDALEEAVSEENAIDTFTKQDEPKPQAYKGNKRGPKRRK